MAVPVITYRKVSDLIFDPENPRLPKSVNGNNESEVIQWMLENENVTELMASIAEKGFFAAEPLLVSLSKKVEGKWEVIEGNRRLTAVKLLKNPELAVSRRNTISEIIQEGKEIDTLDELPVIIFDNPELIQLYLGYRHITGVQPWDSLAKAKYLKRIKNTIHAENIEDLYRSLAKMIGSRADHVKLLLAGLDVYETIEEHSFFGIKDLDEKSIKFGVLYTAINNSNIAYFIGVDLDQEVPVENIKLKELSELSGWMFEKNGEGFTRLGESRNLRLLNKVVESPKALEAFRKEKSLKDAVLLTNEPQEIFHSSIQTSLNNLQTARDYMHLIEQHDATYQEILLEITKLGRTISATLRAQALDQNEEGL